MRFLVDADLPRSAVHLLRRYGHGAVDVRDIGLRDAKDRQIAAYARREGYCLLTGDFHFADVRNYPPKDYPGLVILKELLLPFRQNPRAAATRLAWLILFQ